VQPLFELEPELIRWSFVFPLPFFPYFFSIIGLILFFLIFVYEPVRRGFVHLVICVVLSRYLSHFQTPCCPLSPLSRSPLFPMLVPCTDFFTPQFPLLSPVFSFLCRQTYFPESPPFDFDALALQTVLPPLFQLGSKFRLHSSCRFFSLSSGYLLHQRAACPSS